MSEQMPVMMLGDHVIVSIPNDRVFVSFDSVQAASTITDVRTIVDIAGSHAVIPGEGAQLTMRVHNPTDREIDFEFDFDALSGVIAQPDAAFAMSVPAGETLTRELKLLEDHNRGTASSGDAPEPHATLRWRLGDQPDWSTKDVPLRWAIRASRMGLSATKPEPIVLQTFDRVVNRNDIDPETNHLTWGGADDLSARAMLGHDGRTLNVSVEVQDDVHRQSNGSSDIWRADSLQIGLTVGGQSGMWEIGLALNETSGETIEHIWRRPSGLRDFNPITRADVNRDHDRQVPSY